MTTKKATPKENNPDCLPATRGYVKLIARKVHKHNHCQDLTTPFAIIFAGLGWLAILIVVLVSLNPPSIRMMFPEWGYWILVAFTIIETGIIIDAHFSSDENYTYYPEEKASIQKWKKPCNEEECEC